MNKFIRLLTLSLFGIFSSLLLKAQTSWTGTVSTNWNNVLNWTAGIPTSTSDVFLGNASFTGTFQPTVNASSSCNSITIGGTVPTTLTLSKNLVVSGTLIINTNATVVHAGSTLTVRGNWTNNGTYTTNNNSAKVIFGGTAQMISGSSTTTFRKIDVNTGTILTLGSNIIATGGSSLVNIYGTVEPGQSPTYSFTSTVSFRILSGGKIKVNAASFAGNYILSGTVTLSAGCMVDYASTTVAQTISAAYTYSTLIISGTGTKTLAANLPALNSTTALVGNILVNSGTLDLASFTANRGATVVGGEINVANGAFLKIGGSTNFPSNYNLRTFALASTVEYNGINQTVSAQTYGNLIFSSGSGASVKTMPATAFNIEGNFTSNIGAGTSVSFTAASALTINGNVNLGVSTIFNGNSYSHTIRGNWVNNGTFTGSTSTVLFDAPSLAISGSGTQNFNNLSLLMSGITATGNLNVSGNIATSGPGEFTHNSGGLITMTGTAKSITGTDIFFSSLTISGSVTTNTSFTINNNLVVSGSFSASSGTIVMSGASNTITGAGTIGFSSLQLAGNITTTSSFSVSTLLDVSGTFSASTGTATFTGSSLLSGTAHLFNVTINGTSLQLATASVLGIANAFTITAGTLNVTATIPNTVNFNGTGAQIINAITYHNLILSNGSTKTALGNITVNSDFTLSAATTFVAGAYTHTILHNWVNNGTFTASTGTIQFTGTTNATVSGTTTFNILTINKSTVTNTVSLLNNITAATVNMTTGKLLTGLNSVTITTTRTGSGIILGTITRSHTFNIATAYAFEGPDNTINFSSATAVTSITVTVTIGNIADFPNNASINREYNIAVTGVSYNATLRLHYEDAELNGNNETIMGLSNYTAAWINVGKSANNTTNNYIEKSGLTNINYRWTCDEIPGVVSWNGSVSSSWTTAANWTNVSGSGSLPPALTDIVQIGTSSFTNHPTITSAVSIKAITFGSVQAATLTIGAGGSLSTSGNIAGNWTADAVHTINAGNQNLTVNGNLNLSNAVNNRSIHLSIGTGTVTIAGSLIQKGNAAVIFSGAGTLNIGTDYSYTSGTFTAGTGTITYNGTTDQIVAGVSYNNISINKTAGTASLNSSLTMNGNLAVIAGSFDLNMITLNVNGHIDINTGATLECNNADINLAGNWTKSGSYIFTSGTVTLNGSGAQTISAGSFNNLTINKTSGIVTLTGNNIIAGNLSILAGTLDLSTYTANRQSVGGIFSMAAGVNLQAGGANNFPANFSTNTLNATSTVHYNGSMAQTVKAVTYGNLTCSNGGSNAKTQSANTAVAGDLLINSTATFHSGGYFTTLSGNWTNDGIFTCSTGTVILNGLTKIITGNTTFNQLTINGSYTVAGSNINYNSNLVISLGASYSAGNGIANVSGNLTNNGTLTSTGTTNFTGTSAQTIRLVNALLSSSTGIINFNGNVAPVLNSTSSPQFATLNINNSAGINPSVNWTVFVAMNVNTGAVFNGGLSSHTVFGSFTNTGTVTSTGTLNFTPSATKTIALGTTGFSSTGTVVFGGTGQMTITGIPGALNNLIISNTHSAGVSAPSSWTVDSNFVVTQYATFNAGSNTYTIGGNLECDGVLNGGTSTFTMTSATAELSVSSETVFNNLTISASGILTPQTDFRVAGNFTNNGAYDGSLAVLIMTGNTAASITGTTTPSSIQQLTIEKTGGAVVSLNVNVGSVLFLNIYSGTLFTSTYSITQDPGGAILIINSDATLKIGGTNTIPAFSGYSVDVNSNIDYAGVATTQTIANSVNYGNLIISGTGSKNAYTAISVMGNLTISNGTFNTNTFTVSHTVAGNFIMTGGTIAGTASTYVLNGTIDQSLNLLSNLFKLTINKAGGYVNLGSNITVTNTLTFISGKIQTGNYSVIMPSGSSVSGAALSTGWVKGNLQKNVAIGTAVSRTFEIGGGTTYLPVTVLFGSVSTAGNLTGKVTETDHIESDYSGIDTTKSVNRFWSLTNAGIGFTTASSTFNWAAADMDAGSNTTKFKTALYNGTSWTLTPMASPLATSIVATDLTSFGDFEIGQRATAYKWTGNAFTADWDNAKNWSGGVPSSLFNTLIPTGITGGRLYPVLSTGTGSVNSLTIESGATLTITEATLQIAGSISNSGIFTSAMGAIELNGVTDQTIPAGLFENNTIKNLIINNNVDFAGTNIVTGTLSVSAGKTLTTNDKLVLRSSASGTARIASLPVDGSGVATAFITGNVTIERYIPMRKAWRLLSAPVKSFGAPSINAAWQEGLTTSSSNPNLYPGYGVFIQGGSVANGFDQGLTSAPSIKIYNNASNAFVGLPPTPGTNAAITSYPGYFLYIRGDRSINLMAGNAAATTQATLRIKGAVNTGDYTSNVNAVNYTILGNPFPSAIDFETISRNNVKNSFYVWDPKLSGNFGLGAYVTFSWNSGTNTYDATTSASPLSQYIPSGEAIIIESEDGINPGMVTIKESDKTAHGSDFVFGRYNGPAQKVRVNLYSLNANSSTSLLDAVLTTYDDNNTNELDKEDAKKLNGGSENIGIKRSNSMLAIERRATITRNDTTYLNIYQMKIQDYQLEIIAENMDATNTMAVIKDRYSNTINNMPLNSNGTTLIRFKITSDPASYAINRFSIVFAPNVVLPVTFHTIKAYKQQKDIAVEWTTENEVNIKHYEVERSANGRSFEKIHTTTAVINNGMSASYKFTDTHPFNGNNYYRIRSVEQDNLVAYSSIAKVAIEVVAKTPAVVVFPNPVTGNNISLQLNDMVKGNYSLRLFNASGQLVGIKNIQLKETSYKGNFQVIEKFPAGKYELNVAGEGTQINTPVIKR